MGLLLDICIGLSTGLISGLISGIAVYWLTKRREKKYQTYYLWRSYLFDALRHCEMYIPVDLLDQLSDMGGKESEFGKAVYAILDDTRLFDTEDRELTDRENRIAKNVLTALKELGHWKKQNHLH